MKKNVFILIFLSVVCSGVQAGSLYDEEVYTSLVSDRIAHQVGDSITVLIYESTSASASANTDTSRSTDVSGSVLKNNGTEGRRLSLDSDFNGSAGVNRTGNLLASITARVMEVDANGELLIEGKQFIEMNEDKQTIHITGRLRKSDIGPNNTVISTRLSDANISYMSEGLLADQQKPGWISRFFNWIF